MVYGKHNLDRDVFETGGIRGMALADAVYYRPGGLHDVLRGEYESKKPDELEILASIYQVASQPFPNEHMAGPIKPREVRIRFKRMREICPKSLINSYGRRTEEVISSLKAIREELRVKLEELAPELLVSIDKRNAKFIAEDMNPNFR